VPHQLALARHGLHHARGRLREALPRRLPPPGPLSASVLTLTLLVRLALLPQRGLRIVTAMHDTLAWLPHPVVARARERRQAPAAAQ